jgi:hypothetical protein
MSLFCNPTLSSWPLPHYLLSETLTLWPNKSPHWPDREKIKTQIISPTVQYLDGEGTEQGNNWLMHITFVCSTIVLPITIQFTWKSDYGDIVLILSGFFPPLLWGIDLPFLTNQSHCQLVLLSLSTDWINCRMWKHPFPS